MSKTKRIKTKKEKNLRKLDIVFIIVCLLLAEIKIDFNGTKFLIDALKVCDGNIFNFAIIFAVYLWLLIFNILYRCYIPIAIYLGFRILRMKSIKENSKYQVIDNIEYYRDRFNNITPTEISLITDLEIETKKDITATILSLYQKGIIKFDNQIIRINENEPNKQLKSSELEIIEMIKENDFSSSHINQWKEICFKEAQEDNYIKQKYKREKGPDFSINNKLLKYSAIVFIISLLIGCAYVTYNEELFNKLDEANQYYNDSTQSDMEFLLDNPQYKEFYIDLVINMGPFMILTTVMGISFFILIGIPIYRFIKRLTHKVTQHNNMYERTSESNILIEQIAGIKNYIHDFSLLSEKEKEQVLLWEDFLIYAILLEENQGIIEDIFKYKNIDLDLQTNLRTIIDII